MLKSTGIVRKVDDLGRIVLPIELRKNLGISDRDSFEIFTSNDKIVLKKYQPADIFSDETDDLIEYKGKKVSKKSIIDMAKLIGIIDSNAEINTKNDDDELKEEIDDEVDNF